MWSIPRRRIIRFERFFEIEMGQSFVWTCLECCQGVIVPREFVNSYDETVSLDPENLPEDVIVIQL